MGICIIAIDREVFVTDCTLYVTVNDDEKGHNPTNQQQEMCRIARRPMYDSSDEKLNDMRGSQGIFTCF